MIVAMSGLVARPLARVRRSVAPFFERLVEVELFDRAVALASQAFVALIPLMVVSAALMPYDQQPSFADSIVSRFHLTGPSADAVEVLFATPGGVTSTLNGVGVFLLIISALSFCRAMQRLYEKSWRLAPRGLRSSGSHLLWLALFALYASIGTTLNTAAGNWLGPGGRLAVGFGISLRRLAVDPLPAARPAHRAARAAGRQAVLTATGMTAFSAGSLFYMPQSIASSAEQFGSIGIAIAIVSWLIGGGFVLVVAGAFGAVLADRSGPVRPSTPRGAPPAPLQREPHAGRAAAGASRRTAGRRTSRPPRCRPARRRA